MLGRSSSANSLNEENLEVLYRPSRNGERKAHRHRVDKITRRQVQVQRLAEDGTPAASDRDREGTWTLSRRELEERGYALHGTIQTRFYLSEEEALS